MLVHFLIIAILGFCSACSGELPSVIGDDSSANKYDSSSDLASGNGQDSLVEKVLESTSPYF